MDQEKKTTKKTATKKAENNDNEKLINEETTTTKNDININDIPPELIQQILSLAKQTEEHVEEKEEAQNKIFTKADLHKIKDEEIVVKNICGGMCTYESKKTHMEYNWNEIGAEEYMSIDEVINMNNTDVRFFRTSCWLEPMDDRVKQGLGISKNYEIISKVSDIDSLINMNIDKITELVSGLDKEFKKSLAGEIYNKIINKELRDTLIIETFENLLNIKF